MNNIEECKRFIRSGHKSEDTTSVKLDILAEDLKSLADVELKKPANFTNLIEIYGFAIDLHSKLEFLMQCRSNRSLCYLKNGQSQLCIDDCQIIMSSLNCSSKLKDKAFYRVIEAYIANLEFEKAREMLKTRLPQDTHALKEFSKITLKNIASLGKDDLKPYIPVAHHPFVESLFRKIHEMRESKNTLDIKSSRANHCSNEEFFAFVDSAVRRVYGYNLRPVQIVALALFACKSGDKGLLLQMTTGQGKTIIVQCWAIFCALRISKTVNVSTSHKSLAVRETIGKPSSCLNSLVLAFLITSTRSKRLNLESVTKLM